jgi:hypothetical protein
LIFSLSFSSSLAWISISVATPRIPRERLMDEEMGIGKTEPIFFLGSQVNKSGGAGDSSHADGDDIRFDEAQHIENGITRIRIPSRGINETL